MRIAIFTNNYLPNPFGVASSIESFRLELEALGHQVFVFAPEVEDFFDENANVFRYPSFDIKYKISFPLPIPWSEKISKKMNNLHFDIVHSQHPNLLGLAASRWSKKKEAPLIFTWHTLYDQYAHYAPPFIPKKIATWWIIRNAVKYANKAQEVIVPTKSIQEIIRKWGVNNQNIHVVPTGIEERLFEKANRESIRKKYKIEENEYLLLLVSRLSAEKNVEFLLEAAGEVLKDRKNVKLLIVGEGDLKNKLEKTSQGKEFEGRVHFAGLIGKDKLKDYFAAGDIFVYASKSETQGMVISEAMYAGLPVVAVKASGVQDLVADGESGFLVDEDKDNFSSAVKKLIDDKELRESFSQNAKEIAKQNYTSQACTEKLLGVYRNAIKNKKNSKN